MTSPASGVSASAVGPKVEKFTYDRLFQVRMLRTLYQDPDFTTSVGAHLSPIHFERRAHRWIAEKILTYAKKHAHGIGEDALKIAFTRDLKIGKLNKENKREVEG